MNLTWNAHSWRYYHPVYDFKPTEYHLLLTSFQHLNLQMIGLACGLKRSGFVNILGML